MRKTLTRLPYLWVYKPRPESSTRACSDSLLLTKLSVYIEKSWSGYRGVTLSSKKGGSARRVTFLAEPTFSVVSHVNGFLSFVRKCRKVGSKRVAQVGKWPFTRDNFSPYKWALRMQVILTDCVFPCGKETKGRTVSLVAEFSTGAVRAV